MVGSVEKRRLASYFHEVHERPVKRCCDLSGISRASWYYNGNRPQRDKEVEAALRKLSENHPTRGFDNYYARLREAGHRWGRSRVLRIYRSLGLRRQARSKRKVIPSEDRKPMAQLTQRNEVWALDFLSDALSDGRTARVLAIMDEYSREALGVEASISYPGQRVCRVLDRLAEQRGAYPQALRTDNGPEFMSKALAVWCEANGVYHQRINPGRPMENGRIERLNRTIREDVLDFWQFASFGELNEHLKEWKKTYNKTHPHSALGGQTPEAYEQRKLVLAASASRPHPPELVKEKLPLI